MMSLAAFGKRAWYACLVAAGLMIFGVTALPAGWNVGVGRANITPKQFMPMAGYASRGANHAESKLNDLWAKAVLLNDGQGHKAVLITFDLIGIDRALELAICERLKQEFGLERHQIALNFSHTHTGPVVAGNLRPMHLDVFDEANQKLVSDYSRSLVEFTVEAVRDAVKSEAPAELSWGSGKATFAVNRRNNPEKEVPQRRAAGELKGPFDHDVPVLAVRRGDKLAAVVFGYACHNTTLSSQEWSGDYAGFAQENLEAALPGTVALYWAGCGADQNPIPRRELAHVKDYGKQLADAVEAVLKQELRPVSPRLKTQFREINLTFAKIPTREELVQETQGSNKYVAVRAKSLLEDLDSGKGIETSYPYPVAFWNLGDDLQWLFLGGEVVVDFALRFKQDLGQADRDGTNVWVAGYSNDVMAYIPSLRVLLEGGYEGGGAMIYYGRPSAWAQDVEDKIIKEGHRQAGR